MNNRFHFGVGVSSYQVEGAPSSFGKLPSIWDTYSHTEGMIKQGHNGDVAINFFKTYSDDIKNIKDLGIDSFRFSIAWTRVVNEDGTPNKKGLMFYKDLITSLKENGLRPVVTIYHWDLPQHLEDNGGWVNRDIVTEFANYVEIITSFFKDEVDEYVTINEPQCVINNGYKYGSHAPGKKLGVADLLKVTHHVLLAHAEGYHIVKKNCPSASASICCTNRSVIPTTPKDEEKAYEKYFEIEYNDFYNTSMFLDPIFLGDYPKQYYKLYKKYISNYIKPGDLERIKGTSDICYQNIYWGLYYGKNAAKLNAEVSKGDLDWLRITPLSLYYGPKFLYRRYKTPVLITENGLSIKDNLVDGKVHDEIRIKFIKEYFEALEKAQNDGVEILGYYYWSIFDNFEWAEGYTSRFGLIYVDYETQARYKKDSYFFYQQLIKEYKDRHSND